MRAQHDDNQLHGTNLANRSRYAIPLPLVRAQWSRRPRLSDRCPQVRSAEEDLTITVAILRRIINHHESAIHRLPPEILATVAPHLGDRGSLITVTHVCHRWRMALLSSPRLWSHLKFGNEECALAFLERSKLAPVSVDLVGVRNPSEGVIESLNRITPRLTALRGTDTALLDGLLGQPVPMLRTLYITGCGGSGSKKPTRSLPSVLSLVLGAVRCQSAKTARAWCIAGLAIGKCGGSVGRRWQDELSAPSASLAGAPSDAPISGGGRPKAQRIHQ